MASKKPRQQRIPGTEGQKIKELDHAAEQYVAARNERMELTESEVEARDALIQVMEQHELTVYRDDDASPPLVITLVPGKAKVKVTQADPEDEVGDEREAG